MDNQYPYEKTGLLYLGRELDIQNGAPTHQPLLYKNKNMTTHGVIIGMTGSGKTGLGIGLVEEAIMDNVPSIIIDPKGDMGNLLLTFPQCAPSDFLPWIDPTEASRKEMTIEEYAEKTARSWKDGLRSWGQEPERIATLKNKTDMTIYTPGSSAGVSVSVLSSFRAPAEDVLGDIDTLNSLVSSTATSLLALIDVQGDPLQSREHILLSSLFLYFWRAGEDLSLEALIGHIVSPPFKEVGVFSLDTFYPQAQRMQFAMSLNNILASPTFSSWTQGDSLDIQRILYTEEGKPRTAIFSISHLSEAERMFFVTMLLNQFIGWMRRQKGAASLKTLLYMDEIFGYFPPTANPPSKKPMLLLLKQARAFGVGVVLATQNPVDLDYKGLSNIGTWFVGRLQTRQDQEKVLEGIVGASDGKLDTRSVKRMLSDMKGRQFLLNSIHLDEPLLFETRWVMSYLKGPISKSDIKKLMEQKKKVTQAVTESSSGVNTEGLQEDKPEVGLLPIVSESIEQRYHLKNVLRPEIRFEPWLSGAASVRFFNAKRNIDVVTEIQLRLYLDESFSRPDWNGAEELPYHLDDCKQEPPDNCSFYPLPSAFGRLKNLRAVGKKLSDHLYHSRRLELFKVVGTTFESRVGESLGDFKVRYNDHLREQKEVAIEKMRHKFQVRQDRLDKKLERAFDKLDKEQIDVRSKTTDSIISFGVAVVGALFGRKAISAGNISKAATGMRSVGRVAKEKSDVKRAEQNVENIQQTIAELHAEMSENIVEVADSFDMNSYNVETFSIKPRRSDIFDLRVILLWEMVT